MEGAGAGKVMKGTVSEEDKENKGRQVSVHKTAGSEEKRWREWKREKERALFTHIHSSKGEDWMCEIQRCGNSLLWNFSSAISAVSRNSLGVRKDRVPAQAISSFIFFSYLFYPCSSHFSNLPPLKAPYGGNWLYLEFVWSVGFKDCHCHVLCIQIRNKNHKTLTSYRVGIVLIFSSLILSMAYDILLICVYLNKGHSDLGILANRMFLKFTWLNLSCFCHSICFAVGVFF